MSSKIKWNKDSIIQAIQRYVDTFGEVPTYATKSTDIYPSSVTIAKRFGSFNRALTESGFNVNRKYYTKEDLISEIQRFHELYGHVPTQNEMASNPDFPSTCTFQNTFGSWNNALIAARFDINKHSDKLTGNEICSICRSTSSKPHWYFYNNQRICSLCFNKTPKEKERHSIRRRELGMKPINDYFSGSHFHHLHLNDDHAIGLYIPAKLHMAYRHNSKTMNGMKEINDAAYNWYFHEHLGYTIEGLI